MVYCVLLLHDRVPNGDAPRAPFRAASLGVDQGQWGRCRAVVFSVGGAFFRGIVPAGGCVLNFVALLRT